MRVQTVVGIALLLSVVVGVQGCGGKDVNADASSTGGGGAGAGAADSGAGGSSTGGRSGSGGRSTGGEGVTGGAPNSCDISPCQDSASTVRSQLFSLFPTEACCLSASSCGVQITVPGLPAQCADSKGVQALIDIIRGIFDAGVRTPNDAGIVELPDGGSILLDPSCPDVDGTTPANVKVTFPGCCLPTGRCGASNHVYPIPFFPIACASYTDLSTLGTAVKLPPKEKTCGAQPDAGEPDAKAEDASRSDARAPDSGLPDAGSREAGIKDASAD